MGAAIPSLQAGLLNQSSAQVIDGSLKFKRNSSSSGSYLSRTPSSGGNRTKFTMSAWVKRSSNLSQWQRIFAASPGGSTVSGLAFRGDGNTDGLRLQNQTASWNSHWTSTGKFRDSNGWYHIVMSVDLNLGSGARQKIYINGVRDVGSYVTGAEPTSSQPYYFNNSGTEHRIGSSQSYPTPFDGYMSQFYWIDGQALGPESFGYTDALTNTWRPKKYSGSVNAPISGVIYSSGIAGSQDTSSGGGAVAAFDGTTGSSDSDGSYPAAGQTLTWTPANSSLGTTLPYSSTIRVFVKVDTNGDDGGLIVIGANGSQTVDAGSAGTRYVDISAATTPITSIAWSRASSGGQGVGLQQVEVDGVVLVDGTAAGVNGFYLSMDGNSPIGEDKSGNGNDFKPVNFGGSVALDNPIVSGALPILNTDGGGNVARVGVRTDAYHANLVLALPLVGNANDVSNQINSGSTTKAVTVINAVASSAASNFYGGSWYFDGSGDYLTIANNTDFDFGSGNSTIEMWVYPTDVGSTRNIISRSYSGGSGNYSGFILSTANFLETTNGSSWNITISKTLTANVWQHLAVVRSGDTWTYYINGVSVGTGTASGSVPTGPGSVEIGRRDGQSQFQGYMSDVHVYKGVAKYTSNFVVPVTDPDILPDTPSGVSGGSKLTKVTDGAVSFAGGNDDYLSLSPGADFAFGTGNFTIECYIYSNNRGQYDYIIDGRNSGQTTGTWSLGYGYSGTNDRLQFASSSSILLTCPENDNPEAHKWYHVAVTRSGSSLKMFIDGKEVTSATDSTNISTSPTTSYIGTRYSTENSFDGFISNLRVIKGTALYTSAFTPPTRELTNVTNTKLLCCQSNTSANLAGVSPATFSNDGRTYSSGVTFSPGVLSSTRGADKAFNGTISDNASTTSNNPALLTASFSSNLTSVTSLKIYSGSNSSNAYINGASGSTVSITANNWTDLTSLASGASGTISSISVVTAGDNAQLAAVEVNGCILVDGLVGEALVRVGDTAATNFNPFTTDIDAVRGQETGYATMNPLDNGGLTLANGNLDVTMSTSAWRNCRATTGMTSGKWYFEVECKAATSGQGLMPGILNAAGSITTTVGANSGGYAYNAAAGQKYNNNSGSSYGASFDNGDTISVAYDGDNGTITFYKNGVSQGVAFTSIPSDTYFPAVAMTGTMSASINFGQKPFKFPPPAGFQPVNAANVKPETVIARPDHYVQTTIWSGNDSNPRGISTPNLKPDLVWIKTRNAGYHHGLFDSVRGAGGAKRLYSDQTYAEGGTAGAEGTAYGELSAFNNGGFTVNTGTTSDIWVNNSGNTYVAWTWKAGGNKNTFNVDDVGYASAAAVGMNVGGQNSNAYDQSKTWSTASTITGSPDSASYSYSNVFDGTLYPSATAQADNSQTPYVYKPNTAISGNTIRISIAYYGNPNDDFFQVNNVSYGNNVKAAMSASTETWFTLPIQTINTTNGISLKADGTNSFNLAGIEVDGKLLVDQGLTPANAPLIANTGASVGTKQGFSIIKYTGSGSNGTLAHGLSQAPDFFFGRDLEDTGGSRDWIIYHKSIGNTGRLKFTDGDTSTSSVFFQNTSPTNSLITIGTSNDINSTNDYILYCWHDVPGLQKFGKYTGNNDSDAADGPFAELGFRPALVAIKRLGTGNWIVYDNKRDTFNPLDGRLKWNTSGANVDNSGYNIDFLSNGFKITGGNNDNYNAASTYIYCAWAEAPSFNLFGGQSNAR